MPVTVSESGQLLLQVVLRKCKHLICALLNWLCPYGQDIVISASCNIKSISDSTTNVVSGLSHRTSSSCVPLLPTAVPIYLRRPLMPVHKKGYITITDTEYTF